MGRPRKTPKPEAEVKEVEVPEVAEVEVPEVPEVSEVEETRVEVGENVYIDTEVKNVGVQIECRASDRVKAAQDAYAYLEGIAEAGDVVIVRNRTCGNAISIEDIEKFPAKNRKCACGNKLHTMIKYKFI